MDTSALSLFLTKPGVLPLFAPLVWIRPFFFPLPMLPSLSCYSFRRSDRLIEKVCFSKAAAVLVPAPAVALPPELNPRRQARRRQSTVSHGYLRAPSSLLPIQDCHWAVDWCRLFLLCIMLW